MNDFEKKIVDEIKLTALAESIYKETNELGFESADYIKLMNELLEMTMQKNETVTKKNETQRKIHKISELPIKSNNLTISLYNPETDKEIVSKWFNDKSNKLFFLSRSTKNELFPDTLKNDEKNIFATISVTNGPKIGLLGILNIDKDNRKGEMRKMIGELEYRGRGFARESTEIWLKYCTDFLDLNKIYISTIDTNVKNIALNRQLGFKIEGYLRNEIIINNKEHDILRMAYFKR